MSELSEFLLARITEDERVAGGLTGATVIFGQRPDFYGAGGPAAEDYWQRFTAYRALAECEAKRRIIRWMTDDTVMCEAADPILQSLALPYADHPDFREEWRA